MPYITTEDEEEMTATEAILKAVEQLADKCQTLEEFKKALAEIIKDRK